MITATEAEVLRLNSLMKEEENCIRSIEDGIKYFASNGYKNCVMEWKFGISEETKKIVIQKLKDSGYVVKEFRSDYFDYDRISIWWGCEEE